jgi:hemoglobin
MECMDLALEEHVADLEARAQMHENLKKLADFMRNTD